MLVSDVDNSCLSPMQNIGVNEHIFIKSFPLLWTTTFLLLFTLFKLENYYVNPDVLERMWFLLSGLFFSQLKSLPAFHTAPPYPNQAHTLAFTPGESDVRDYSQFIYVSLSAAICALHKCHCSPSMEERLNVEEGQRASGGAGERQSGVTSGW